MKKKIIDDEIDFIGILISSVENKTKIILITLITVIICLGLYLIKKQKFDATTKLEQISIFEESSYLPYNSYIDLIKSLDHSTAKKITDTEIGDFQTFKFNKIDRNYLLSLFLAKINDEKILSDKIVEFNLIDKQKFKDEKLYLEAVKKLALTLEIIPPRDSDKKTSIKGKNYWQIKFKTFDKDKWELILKAINDEINNEIRDELILKHSIQKKTAKLLVKFQLEDINGAIINSKYDYEIEIKKRLAFLNEQALIARELGIQKNTLGTLNYESSYIVSNIQTENPYYMYGYDMIEKEIELIMSRKDKNSFTNNLSQLERKKRTLLQNLNLERADQLFDNTPIFKSENFRAVNIIYNNTEFKNISKFSLKFVLLFSIIGGLTLGIIFIVLAKAIQERK
jgi:LPS O-antigen subunit length determinant protein (WzzB/FepE family)